MTNDGSGLGTMADPPGWEAFIPSVPPSGKCKVVNIYVDPDTGKLVIEYEEIPVP